MSNIVIPDGGNIGSTSDTDAISIASDGGLTFNGGIDNAGTISAGTFNGTVGSSSTFNDGINSANINQFTAKAWVYWTGYQTPVAQNSFNATLTRSSTGIFYITFTNNMSNANFVVFAQGQVTSSYPQTVNIQASSKSTSRTGSIVFRENTSNEDPWTGQIVVFGD